MIPVFIGTAVTHASWPRWTRRMLETWAKCLERSRHLAGRLGRRGRLGSNGYFGPYLIIFLVGGRNVTPPYPQQQERLCLLITMMAYGGYDPDRVGFVGSPERSLSDS